MYDFFTYFLFISREYYFSEENLANDIFMRRKMSKDGFIPVSLIASFNRMKQLTQDVKLIVDVCKTSDKLEVKDEVWVSILTM